MAKYPVAGQVKTRLAAALGDEAACALYRAFILDLAARVRRLPYAVTWAYWPPRAPFPALLPRARCRPQDGRDLGERLAHVVRTALTEAREPLLIVGADVPHLPVPALAEACRALAEKADVVLGPAADGGYYLVGLRQPHCGLFEGITWGTASVLDATLARARALGLTVRLVAPSFDLDEPADLQRLRCLLAGGEVRLPRTARLLERSPFGAAS